MEPNLDLHEIDIDTQQRHLKGAKIMAKTIVVLGGTGMLGQPVARHLKEVGFGVRIVTRDLEKARKLHDDFFEMVAGDPMDAACLEEALHGCYGVHMSLPSEVEQTVAETVAKVAGRHGLERITYVSGATVAEENRWFPMVDRKYLAEQAIRKSGIPYTIFCPTWFMESLPMFVRQGRAAVLGKQPYPSHWVAADDFAEMVATAYALGAAANGRYIVHGPEAIPMLEALRRYCAVCQPDIKQVSTMPLWLVRLLATVTGNRELKGAGELMAYFEKVGEGSNAPQDNSILGTPATTLDMWLEDRFAERLSLYCPESEKANRSGHEVRA
jgi:uncharacterized protein YbjT (DUF2867 family)